MSTRKHYAGALLLALSLVFALWDGGEQGGRLLVAVALFVCGFIALDVNGARRD